MEKPRVFAENKLANFKLEKSLDKDNICLITSTGIPVLTQNSELLVGKKPKIPSYETEVADLKERYIAGKVGDVEVKEKLAVASNKFLDPIRERRAGFENNKKSVQEALEAGTAREKKIAQETMKQVRDAMKITNY